MRKFVGVSAVALAALLVVGAPAAVIAKDDPKAKTEPGAPVNAKQKLPPAAIAFEKSLHKQTGDIAIPQAKAVLHLGDRYYFLGAEEARKVIVDAWGNPPESAGNVLGLVLEKNASIFDNVWGAVITYEASGHVSDDDAAEQDYSAVLTQMQAGDAEDNARRSAAGLQTMTTVGWAQPPSYDKATHSLIWAREFAISGEAVNALNYDVRLLGRTGVLSLNMVSSMKNLADVQAAAQAFGKSVTFEPGGGYADYVSGDHTADYGLAGLVAGGVGLAVAKKAGLLGLILVFGKKFLVLIIAGGVALLGGIGRLFGRKRKDEDDEGTI